MESNLALLASPLVDRANYLHPKELYICSAVDLRQFTEVLTFAPGLMIANFPSQLGKRGIRVNRRSKLAQADAVFHG